MLSGTFVHANVLSGFTVHLRCVQVSLVLGRPPRRTDGSAGYHDDGRPTGPANGAENPKGRTVGRSKKLCNTVEGTVNGTAIMIIIGTDNLRFAGQT